MRKLTDERKACARKHTELAGALASTFASQHNLPHLFDDLHGEALLALTEAAGRFDETRGAKFTTFATCKIKGALKNYIKKQVRTYEADSLADDRSGADSENPEAPIDAADMIATVLDGLPTDQATALQLRFLDNQSIAEVARVMGLRWESCAELLKTALASARALAE